jgi:hypothetical protein
MAQDSFDFWAGRSAYGVTITLDGSELLAMRMVYDVPEGSITTREKDI